MSICIYTLTSRLHDKKAIDQATHEFLSTLKCNFTFKDEDYSNFGHNSLDLIYVRTGGTEGIFVKMLNNLTDKPRKFYLLTSGQSNSLAASMEILSYLNNNGMSGEILHGNSDYLNSRITQLEKVGNARLKLQGERLGVIGKPSDWLISSGVNYNTISEKLGITLVDIDMSELLNVYNSIQKATSDSTISMATSGEMKKRIIDALKLYEALKVIVEHYNLSGFTIRCFDLLTIIRNTGCLALARFNAEGVIATCEGDIPAMLSMAIAEALTGYTGFQANPARINPETGEILFAHCTIPFNMVNHFELDTHFESGLGIGICGYTDPGPVTIFKTAGDVCRHFAEEGELLCCQNEPNLCRTQQVIKLNDNQATQYFLNRPIGNHHIIVPGHCKQLLDELFD